MTAAGESPSLASAAWRRAQVPRRPKRAPDRGAGSSSHPGPAPWAAPRPSARVVASGFIGINSRAVNSPRSVVFRWPQAAPAWPLLRQPANSRTSSSSPKKPCAQAPPRGPRPGPGHLRAALSPRRRRGFAPSGVRATDRGLWGLTSAELSVFEAPVSRPRPCCGGRGVRSRGGARPFPARQLSGLGVVPPVLMAGIRRRGPCVRLFQVMFAVLSGVRLGPKSPGSW